MLNSNEEKRQQDEVSKIKDLYDQLLRKQNTPFPKPRQKLIASERRGVYIIYNPKYEVDHVGRTPRAKGGIHQRLRNHLNGQSSYVYQHLKGKKEKLRHGYSYKYIEFPRKMTKKDERRMALLEAYATAHLCPKHLGTGSVPRKTAL